jgi:membrane associated rhomboid family serine protease
VVLHCFYLYKKNTSIERSQDIPTIKNLNLAYPLLYMDMACSFIYHGIVIFVGIDMDKERQQFRNSLYITIIFTAVLWIAWLSDYVFELDLPQFGIIPRDMIGLRGILFSPFIHDNRNIWHIVSNTLPFMVLFFVLLNAYKRIAVPVLILIHVLTGIFVWVLAAPFTVHIGISGIIYGMAAFLVGSGLFRRDITSLSIAMLVIFLYGGMVEGFKPQIGVSWESHVCGAVVGFFLSFNFRNFDRKPGMAIAHEDLEEDKHFFERYP